MIYALPVEFYSAIKNEIGSWRDGPVVKSTCSSCRGRFGFQHPQGSLQHLAHRGSDILFSIPYAVGIYICAIKTHT